VPLSYFISAFCNKHGPTLIKLGLCSCKRVCLANLLRWPHGAYNQTSAADLYLHTNVRQACNIVVSFTVLTAVFVEISMSYRAEPEGNLKQMKPVHHFLWVLFVGYGDMMAGNFAETADRFHTQKLIMSRNKRSSNFHHKVDIFHASVMIHHINRLFGAIKSLEQSNLHFCSTHLLHIN
jgi:hypothetical protein